MPRYIIVEGQEALAEVVQGIVDATTARFDTAAQRDTTWPAPYEHAISILLDTGQVDQYVAGAWVELYRPLDTYDRLQVAHLEVAYPTSSQRLTDDENPIAPRSAHAHSRVIGADLFDAEDYGYLSVSPRGFTVKAQPGTGQPSVDIVTMFRSELLWEADDLAFTGTNAGVEVIGVAGQPGQFYFLFYSDDRQAPEMALTNQNQTGGKADLYVEGDVFADNIAALEARIFQLETLLAAQGVDIVPTSATAPASLNVPDRTDGWEITDLEEAD